MAFKQGRHLHWLPSNLLSSERTNKYAHALKLEEHSVRVVVLYSLLQTDPLSCHRYPGERLRPRHIYLGGVYEQGAEPTHVGIVFTLSETHALVACSMLHYELNVWMFSGPLHVDLSRSKHARVFLRLTHYAIPPEDSRIMQRLLWQVKVPQPQAGRNTSAYELKLEWTMRATRKLHETGYLSLQSLGGLRTEFVKFCKRWSSKNISGSRPYVMLSESILSQVRT